MSLPVPQWDEHPMADPPLPLGAVAPQRQQTPGRSGRHPLAVWVLRLFPALILMTLLAALWAGLARLGWALPLLTPHLPMAHGPLMVGGFLGTLIGLERAVAVGKGWAYLAPLCSVTGAILAVAGVAAPAPALFVTLGSLLLLAVLIQIWHTVPALFTATIAVGGLLWWAGNLLWLLGFALPVVVYWWAAFLVLTIAGERLELSRLLRLSAFARGAFVAICLTILAGPLLALADLDWGVRLLGVGLLCMALWLGHYDIARRRLRVTGQARYMAVALLSGYLWLGVSGLLTLYFGGVMAGPAYDALLHALFVGFVLAMIFAHALIILPVFTGYAIRYTAAFYGPLALLHGTLALRVLGDLLPYWPARRWGGLLNEVVLVLFFVLVLTRLAAPPPTRPPQG
jgi:hypothetical protein